MRKRQSIGAPKPPSQPVEPRNYWPDFDRGDSTTPPEDPIDDVYVSFRRLEEILDPNLLRDQCARALETYRAFFGDEYVDEALSGYRDLDDVRARRAGLKSVK